jgi:CheY-like chemotaxis protein
MAQTCRILYVEDHVDTAVVVSKMLRADGFRVTTVGSGGEALAAAGKGRYDLLICDIGLPGQDGVEVMREVRRRYGMRGVAFSAYGRDEDVRRGMAAGFSDYLVKPVQFWKLSEVVRRILEEERCEVPPARTWPVESDA